MCKKEFTIEEKIKQSRFIFATAWGTKGSRIGMVRFLRATDTAPAAGYLGTGSGQDSNTLRVNAEGVLNIINRPGALSQN